ncbi:hypothetical protein [Neorhizobium sp. T7_12]|uniref:hypothetical protein n=1 Tax=Neorhizobium sp. T7_12 TaxID=2093832 RepID=UPI000CFA7438|nr:hypothetical protein [Neorhizobium sp. T7_12]
MEDEEIDGDEFFNRKRTPEEIAQEWREALAELGLSAVELADFMKKNGGDYRPYATILRSIQRMILGEIRVSGEMFVIVRMLLRQHLRLKERHPALQWVQHPTGVFTAEVEDWSVSLSPQSKGRWIVIGTDPSGSSPQFGRWQQGITAAKNKALVCVEEGMSEFAYSRAEHAKFEKTTTPK